METKEQPAASALPKIKPAHRYLLGLIVLCLLLWGIKAIHHAMQPKYQGKTAEEWYQSVPFPEIAFQTQEDATNQPIVHAFKELGPEGVHFLWQEYNRKPSFIELWAAEIRVRVTKDANPFYHPRVAPMKAYFILNQIGPAAEPIIPELIELLLREEPNYPSLAADLLGSIRKRPETVLPALFKSITMPRHNMADRQACIKAIGMYGPTASAYVPELLQMLSGAAIDRREKIFIAAAILRITGDGNHLQQAVHAFFDQHQPHGREDRLIITELEELGPSARAIVPTLVVYAQTAPNTESSNRVARAIKAIDPEGIYHKP